MEALHTLASVIFDIVRIYLKFVFLTLVMFFIAQWYFEYYERAAEAERDVGERKSNNTSSINKIFKLVTNFFLI